jgi:hypothetical protein
MIQLREIQMEASLLELLSKICQRIGFARFAAQLRICLKKNNNVLKKTSGITGQTEDKAQQSIKIVELFSCK